MNTNSSNTIFAEKYRPSTLDDFIGNDDVKNRIKTMIQNDDISHLLFYGKSGTGKTSLAKIICKSIDCEYLYINASDENSVDTVRNKIKDFASTVTFRKLKVIILDESDFLSMSSLAALRNILETYSKTTRFILTCNYIERIIEPIQSRCQAFNIKPPSKKDIAVRLVEILNNENIKYSKEDVATIVSSYYPDIRKCINYTQQRIINGNLELDKAALISHDYKLKILEYFKTGTKSDSFKGIRQLLADNDIRDFTDLYKFLYDSVDDYAKGHIAQVLIIIAEYQYKDSFVVDKEINAMAMVIQILTEIKN